MPHCHRKLLFDFGTSYFSTSLKWLLDTYGKAGIQVCSLRVHLFKEGLDLNLNFWEATDCPLL